MNNASKGRCVTITPRGIWRADLSANLRNSAIAEARAHRCVALIGRGRSRPDCEAPCAELTGVREISDEVPYWATARFAGFGASEH
jgi:hypothetical protein